MVWQEKPDVCEELPKPEAQLKTMKMAFDDKSNETTSVTEVNEDQALELAKNPDTNSATLDQIARFEKWDNPSSMYWTIVENPNVSPETLQYIVDLCLRDNTLADRGLDSGQILEAIFIKRRFRGVAKYVDILPFYVALSPTVNPTVLDKLARDHMKKDHPDDRGQCITINVIGNRNTSLETLKYISLNAADPFIKKVADDVYRNEYWE